eukprot:6197514-Pleurochrysis_carterae.AAC.6
MFERTTRPSLEGSRKPGELDTSCTCGWGSPMQGSSTTETAFQRSHGDGPCEGSKRCRAGASTRGGCIKAGASVMRASGLGSAGAARARLIMRAQGRMRLRGACIVVATGDGRLAAAAAAVVVVVRRR